MLRATTTTTPYDSCTVLQASKLLADEVKKLAKPVDSDDDIRNIAVTLFIPF